MAEEHGETAYHTAKLDTRTRFDVRPQVFVPAAVAIVLFVGLGALFPEAVATVFGTLQSWIADGLGWR